MRNPCGVLLAIDVNIGRKFLYSGGRAGLMRVPAKNVMPRKHTRGRSPPTVPWNHKTDIFVLAPMPVLPPFGVFLCELRAYVCGLCSGKGGCVWSSFLCLKGSTK